MDHLRKDCSLTHIQIELVARQQDVIPTTKNEFHQFPEAQGWTLDQDFKLNIYNGLNAPPHPAKFAVLLQGWLYFGLIRTVVQVDGRPLLEYDDLRRGEYLTTAKLQEKVEDWVRWEISTPEGRWIRLIQAGYVLDKARHVVRRNCACEFEDSEDQVETRGDEKITVKKLKVKAEGYNPSSKTDSRHISDKNALALMLVGECLWAAKSRIIQQCGASLNGWHGDDDSGWGPPRYVLHSMMIKGWCPRAMVLLRGQLRSSATLLLHAYSTYGSSERMKYGHDKCDRDTCRAKTEDDKGNYVNKCLKECEFHDKGGCEMVGPDMHKVLGVLSSPNALRGASDIPLVRFESTTDGHDRVSFTVERLRINNPQPFATVSHVWSDGWGNEEENKLRSCQLRFLRRALRRANNGKDIPFWMDTLIVPVKKFKEGEPMDENWRALKTKAIGQIFKVFAKSAYTIILDNGLCGMPPGDMAMPAEAAMKILASGWMRRLWTLHEAFLSKKRYVTFEEPSHDHNNLKNLEELLEELNSPEAQESPLISWVRDLLLQNIMDKESKIFADPGMRLAQRQAAMLVAGTWRAARWRTTSNAAHETLALATLLNVTYQDTEIEEAGLELDAPEDKMNRLVRDFWREFHATYKNCIPAGIIFLPGEKVQLDGILGYGWAPKTWMSAHEADYPDPLSRWTAETDLLEGKGLLVQYPGFILHTDSAMSRKEILGVDNSSTEPMFTFPVDNSLLEWYSVKPAEPKQKTISYLEAILRSTHPLAIILSRSHPKAWPPEIGLLVEVYSINEDKIRKEGDNSSATTYCCQIIRRVRVWRETSDAYLCGPGRNGPVQAPSPPGQVTPHWKIIGGSFDAIKEECCVGESLPSTQKWIVDGYVPDRGRRKIGPKVPVAPEMPPTASPSLMTNGISSVLRKGQPAPTQMPNTTSLYPPTPLSNVTPTASVAQKDRITMPDPSGADISKIVGPSRAVTSWVRAVNVINPVNFFIKAQKEAEESPVLSPREPPGPGKLPKIMTEPDFRDPRPPERRRTYLWDDYQP